jgi:hypothetical protein
MVQIPKSDQQRIRELAKKQQELANLPIMAERQQLWTDMNDGKTDSRPPFAIEGRTFDRDFMPATIFECTSDSGRAVESQLLRHIRHHEIFNDDHVCPKTFDISWNISMDEFGIEIPTSRAEDQDGIKTGYHFDCPIKDLRDGFDMVKPTTVSVDKEKTLANQKRLQDLFGDILPVRISSGTICRANITQRLMRLMSMETFFISMYDCPDKLAELLGLLRDNAIRVAKWAEEEDLLTLNNGGECTCGTCFNFTTELPKRKIGSDKIRLSDMWIGMDSQETVGVDPQMFHDQIFPHYRQIAELFGLVYWGCCEPADPIWEKSLSQLPNLRAVSISRWANQEYMADALDGRKIVFSRKPNPNLLGVHPELDETAWRDEIRSTLDAVGDRKVPMEFVVRDVYSVHGNLDKCRRATEIALEEIKKG